MEHEQSSRRAIVESMRRLQHLGLNHGTAGNIGLRCVATAGVYVGGGIAPKILPALESGLFLDAFRDKEPMAHLVATMPLNIILNPDAGLLGAAVHAQQMTLR